MSKVTKQMITAIGKMELVDLIQLQSYLNERKLSITYEMKNRLKVGDNVKVLHSRVHGRVGMILEINRTRAKVRFDGQYRASTFTVPISLIQKVK